MLEDFRLRKAKIDGAASQNTAPAPTAQANPNVFKQHRVQRSATEKGAGEEEEEESKLPVLKREVKPYVAVVNNVTTFFSSGDVERLFEVLACYCEAKANKFTFADDSYKVKMSFLDEHSHVEMSAKVLKVPEKEIFAVEFQRNKGDNFKFAVPNLHHRILPKDCSFSFKSNNVQITLRKKKEDDNWWSLFKSKAVGERPGDSD